ncbi:MAG: glycosyltransferase, partial [Clostridia bacterium]|nr:glycosyltransferase [Clostridia bacterium]
MKPLISISIPVYNGENEIESAVRSAVDERLSMEILVVDDGSKDATRERVLSLAKEIPFLRLITQENSGPAAARNRGIDEAKGDYLAFLDSD